MLENLAAQILNRYIGQYVENINTQNLSIGLLKGAVELENLPLKKDALDDFDLPGVILKSGHIGKVILRIKSYKSIKEPWIVEIHRLQLVVGPGEATRTVDKDVEKRKKEEQKQKDLEALEEKWRAKHGQNTSMYSVWYSYSSSIITTIMENLQFEMHDVHIRYEDDVTLPQKFSCGICIKNLTSKTTDERWVPTSGEKTTSDMMFKLLQLDGFSVYWDIDSEMVGHLPPDKLNEKLRKWEKTEQQMDVDDSEAGFDTHSFLLTPVSGQAKLTKNSSSLPLRSRTTPRISLDVILGEISLHLSHTQYKQAIALASEISRSEKRNVYKDGRPKEKIKENSRKWWKWAIDTHMEQIRKTNKRSSKDFLLKRARNNVEYVRMYTKVVWSKMELEKITSTESSLFESKVSDLDKELNFHEIQILRELVFERAEIALRKKQEKVKIDAKTKKTVNDGGKPKGWGGWLRSWVRSSSSEQPKANTVVAEVSDESEIESGAETSDREYDSVYKGLNEDDLYEMFGEELAEQDTNDTFMKRDSVLLKLTFSLDAGTLTLHEDTDSLSVTSPFIGLEFRDLSATTEWRPRYKSSEMKIDLEGLFVKDLSDTNSCFSELVKPQVVQLEGTPHSPRESNPNMSSSIKGIFNLLSANKVSEVSEPESPPVFSLLYKNQPRTNTNQFTNRLEIRSAPIVITFLPNLLERVKDFFKATDEDKVSEVEDVFSAAALEKYETWKQQSQTEIRRTVRRMMDGKTTANVSQDRWAVTLNISAPEIILPENSLDANSNIVIANLGHMTFRNHYEDDILPRMGVNSVGENKLMTEDEIFEDDDDFITPPDTPTTGESVPGEMLSKAFDETSITPSQMRLNEKLFYERMYEQYQIHFTDLQVLVARGNENWEATRSQGKGPHHLVEKFSVDILLERRVVPTLDPMCPAVKLKGSLPNLTIHLSHNKVHSFFNCLDHFSQKEDIVHVSNNASSKSTSSFAEKSIKDVSSFKSNVRSEKENMSRDEHAKSKQIVCQFGVNEISVLLEESPASIISVLEVSRIQAEFTKRPFDHCSHFSIHSLLLVDTKQEIGHDYELLLASHSNVKMDLGSGNIMDSGTTSPDNGPSAATFAQSVKMESSTSGSTKRILSSVANSLKKADVFNRSDETTSRQSISSFDESYHEDLISVEWKVVQASEKNTSKSNADIKFNSLDLVLNLKTWVALLGFLHRLKPSQPAVKNVNAIPYNSNSGAEKPKLSDLSNQSEIKLEVDDQSKSETFSPSSSSVDKNIQIDSASSDEDTEIFVEFHKLNILLMRHIESDRVIGRKVATLSMHNAIIQASVGENVHKEDLDTIVDAHISVGGLALQDLTSAVRDQNGVLRGIQVLCLGDLSDEFMSNTLPAMSSSSSVTDTEYLKLREEVGKIEEAFSCNVQKGKRKVKKRKTEDYHPTYQEELITDLRLASVLYMHSPRLVAEVLALMDEAGDVVNARMATDTKQAYKEMAYSIMDKSIAVLGKSVQNFTAGLDDSATEVSTKGNLLSLFKLTIEMQSPIVALPKCQGSFELLVGNLGKITVKNGHALGRDHAGSPYCQKTWILSQITEMCLCHLNISNRYRPNEEAMDFLIIEISDMSVCSRRQIEEERLARASSELHLKKSMKKTPSGPSLTKLKESSYLKSPSFSEIRIIHDTSIKLNVVKKDFVPTSRKHLDQRKPKRGEDGVLLSDEVYDGPISDKKMCVSVEMTQPLFVSLSKPAYEQVLKTLDHISYGGNIDVDDIEELDELFIRDNSTTDTSISSNKNTSTQQRLLLDSMTSQQSTPSHNREFQMFSAPDLEKITPVVSQTPSDASIITSRKYTPLSADIAIPMIALQLSEDLSDGEQGVVKVTLKGFSAMLQKENRSTTHLDLTLKSLDIEDLLKEENSPHRHIVSSCSYTKSNHSNKESNAVPSYLSTSCPAFSSEPSSDHGFMSHSLPNDPGVNFAKIKDNFQGNRQGVFRPYDFGSLNVTSGPFGVSSTTHEHQSHRSRNPSNDNEEQPWTPPSSPTSKNMEVEDETLVRIRAFLVDGKATAYDEVYDRTNRRIDIDFNSLDCKIDLQTWVVLLDFFGIGTSPKKTYELDQQTAEEYNIDRRLIVNSFYENQPDDFINSEIDFKVRSFTLIFNKEEYEFVKANISKFGTHVQIRNGTLGVSGQLGSLTVSDLSPNGYKYRERFVFAGEKALDFDIKKFDDYDFKLEREFDIRVKLRMTAICYVHTHRFHQELVAYLLHFQQLQEVFGRMRAASVGQEVSESSRRQARILLDIEADSPVLLIPESSHSDRLVVADLGNLTVKNSFKLDGSFGTLSESDYMKRSKQENPDTSQPLSPSSQRCLLDVLHADLEQMDLYTAVRSDNNALWNKNHCSENKSILVFTSFIVKRDENPLLREKCRLSLQIERNLEKETMVRNVPDTSVCGQLSSVYCTVDLQQYWLVRGILDHNLGEPIPEFPQPTACLQPSDIQTVLSGSVYTGMSIDMHLLNVSVELLHKHKTFFQNEVSLARLDYVKSRLSYRSFSDQTKTINLSCEAFVASDTRWKGNEFSNSQDPGTKRSVFTAVLGPTHLKKKRKEGSRVKDSELQLELQLREGPGFFCFTALLVDMRVYIISDWLQDVYRYIIVNPAQEWCDSLRAKAAELLSIHKQVVPGQEKEQESIATRDETFRLNVTNTDFVLVEDSTRVDSDAVILRITSVLHHNPKRKELSRSRGNTEHRKIIDCTLQSLEVFSCQLDCENDTALSIVDPVKVGIEIEDICQKDLTSDEISHDPSLLDRTKLEIHVSEMNMRVSYNDLLLFLAIMKSLSVGKKEEKTEKKQQVSGKAIEVESYFQPPVKDIENLMQLGYARRDVVKALQKADGSMEQAVDLLLENAEVIPDHERMRNASGDVQKLPFNIGKLFLIIDSVRICLIDDCADCDVPLAELAIRSLEATQNTSFTNPEKRGQVPTNYAGKGKFVLCGDYYNRMLSLWEPYLEPVRFGLKWNYETGPTLSSTGRWDVGVQTSDKLDITVTSTMIETLKKTKETWTKSFNRANEKSQQSENLIDFGPSVDHSFSRKRKEFVPYILRNLTGEVLKFKTHVSAIQRPSSSVGVRGSAIDFRREAESWFNVMPGDRQPFRFDRTVKQRHKRSDEIILHQIITKIGDLETIQPVTISKVGVYFRHATEEIVKSSNVLRPPDPVRVVFSVTLEGSAHKVVTVRSALVIRSKVKIPVQVHLTDGVEAVILPRLDPGGVQYIPLRLTGYGIKIRPVHSSRVLYKPSTQTIHWNKIQKDVSSTSGIISCFCQTYPSEQSFRFSACLKKKSYPSYEEVAERLMSGKKRPSAFDDEPDSRTKFGHVPPLMPGHSIIILPPVVVSNLLPCDLHYYFKDTEVGGKLSPGQDATLHILRLEPGSIDQPPLLLGCGLEGFKECRELTISHMVTNTQMRMAMVDHQDRTLILNVRVFWRLGCSVKISIMAGYWIVNKTGLPIVMSQDGLRSSSAGQYDEHEKARSLTPLLFSYSDRELPYLCTMRLGRETSQDSVLDRSSKYPHQRASTPYCQSFSIDGGTCTRNLTMINHDNTPSRVYYIGVGVRRGWGRYMHTHIVTLAPRFLLINLTKSRTLSFAQLHATSFTDDAAGLNRHLSIIPGSSVVFHWPRADLDLLLCTRLTEEDNCRWSGGFIIDRIDAFHIHLRIFGGASGNHSIFLRVEITLVDATYRVMFYDGDISSCPSPLRIDNISAAPLVIRQCNTDEGLQIDVNPSSSVPYACDEPCLPPVIDCRVQGGAVSTQLNMDKIDDERVLYYENFIYIVVGKHSSSSFLSLDRNGREDNQLVLSVQQVHYDQSVDGTGHLVTLQKRRPGNRSQLWRMTSEGFLRHEGSSPPGGGSKYPSSGHHQGLVLDIAELAMSRGDIMPLTVRNIDMKRKSQIWKFTDDGRLCSSFKNLCVKMSSSGEVGLAPFIPGGLVTTNESCRSEKMIAGSGVLSLRVVRDGPTRVISVMDIKQKRAGMARGASSWSLLSRQSISHSVDPQMDEKSTFAHRRITFNVDMAKGLGFSLVTNAPEELLYFTMSGVRLEASFDEKLHKFGLKIQRVQIDNQILGGRPPVMLHPYESSSSSKSSSSLTEEPPAISIDAVKLPSTNQLYEIYHSLKINIGRMCLQLEETLLLKLMQFIGSGFSPDTDLALLDETKMDHIHNTTVSKTMMNSSKRYYFDSFIVAIQPMQLSMFTASASTLDSELKAIKQTSSLVLVQFERAPVTMQAYERQHVFETTVFVLEEAKKHFIDQLRGQAAKILGSVDFLGNPIGLISDLKAGLGSFVQGKPGNLVKHITHGFSNSAAKFTGTLSTLSGGITMDQDHEEKRRAIRANPNNATDHFVAGLQSLGTGLVGGLTSIVTQTVKGASDKGTKGFFTGFGKGLVGTFTKPVTGVLDFASETASFVRDSSISSNTYVQKTRLPRTCHSFQGCLECFSKSQAENQRFLYSFNASDYDEWLFSLIEIKSRSRETRPCLVTNKRIYLMRNKEPDQDGVSFCVNYNDLVTAVPFEELNEWGVELAIKMDHASSGSPIHYSSSRTAVSSAHYPAVTLRKPRITCHSEATAKRICEHVNYAKMLASEQSETLPINDDDTENDKAFDLEV